MLEDRCCVKGSCGGEQESGRRFSIDSWDRKLALKIICAVWSGCWSGYGARVLPFCKNSSDVLRIEKS